jgi:RNA recognition motif-containing protein
MPSHRGADRRRARAAATVFVGNLPWSVTEEGMREWFSEIGEVVAVRIAEDYETGKRKGFGHVEFAAAASARKAMEFNGEELEGRALRIDVSAPRARAPSPLPSRARCACSLCLSRNVSLRSGASDEAALASHFLRLSAVS